jgi:hypothetical protein
VDQQDQKQEAEHQKQVVKLEQHQKREQLLQHLKLKQNSMIMYK